jgi:hypothetical protein
MSDLVYIADVVKCVIRINIIYKKVPLILHVCGGISVVCISSGLANVSHSVMNSFLQVCHQKEYLLKKVPCGGTTIVFELKYILLALTFCFHVSTKLLPFCTITQNGNKIIDRFNKIST